MGSVIPIVAVEVAPAPPPDGRELEALLRACSRALPAGSCESTTGLNERKDLQIAATARVTWSQGGDALVAVRLGGSDHELTRDLAFAAGDRELERWRSVGLAIATIVDELRVQREAQANPPDADAETSAVSVETKSAPSPQPPAAAAPKTFRSGAERADRSPAPPHDARAPQPASSLEAGALVGTGLSTGVPRAGVYARAARDLSNLPAYVQVRLAYAVLASPGEPSVAWSELALGSGVYLATTSVRLEADAGLQVVRTSASARSPVSGKKDEAGSWLPGVALSSRLAWPSQGVLRVLVGVQGAWVMRELVVTNAGAEIGRVPAYSVGLFLGVRVAL